MEIKGTLHAVICIEKIGEIPFLDPYIVAVFDNMEEAEARADLCYKEMVSEYKQMEAKSKGTEHYTFDDIHRCATHNGVKSWTYMVAGQ